VQNYERRLVAEDLVTGIDVRSMREVIAAEIANAFEAARAAPFPVPADLGRYVYPT
jgi:TPP-dependent pyruvate/acetoin dehydrogenase alpha subunit